MNQPTPLLDDCWRRIGVRGDRSCGQLAEHAHCHNCPVYSAAAKQLLRRTDTASSGADELAERYARAPVPEDGGAQSVLLFRIGAEWLALPSLLLDEIAEQRPVRALPHRRGSALLGIVNVRGELLVCTCIARVLGIEAGAPPEAKTARSGPPRLLVLNGEQGRFACPVDEVHGVHRFHAHALQPLPATVAQAAARYTQAVLPWGQRTVGVLDAQLLLYTLTRSLA